MKLSSLFKWGQIPAEKVPCQVRNLKLITSDDELTLYSERWPIGGTGMHTKYLKDVKVLIGEGNEFKRYTLETVSVVKNTEECIAHEVKLTIPWDGSRLVGIKTYSVDGVGTDFYRRVKPNSSYRH